MMATNSFPVGLFIGELQQIKQGIYVGTLQTGYLCV
jgi:hypothetical protein